MSKDTIFVYANEINSCNLEKSEHFKLINLKIMLKLHHLIEFSLLLYF